ncbi:MAG: ATP-binding protein [Saprospiraceae bacterium]|nr:ATP-binding protein [Saprospiraceae bacterium]
MLIVRQIGEKIRQVAKTMPVVSITGPRQSGKTTLAQQIFPDYQYANLENPLIRDFAQSNPVQFLNQGNGRGLIIDEAQYVPELFSWIQVHVDETLRNGEIVLSGSQNFLLMEKITQSLAGRVAIFNLLPFSTEELRGSVYGDGKLYEYIFQGLYPRIYSQQTPPDVFYPSYIQSYVERDVRQVQAIGDLALFEKFLGLCAGRVGQIFNQTALANETGVSLPTIHRWMSILQTGFIAYLLQPYHRNFNKRLTKTPKLYFYDTGLACSLLRLRSASELDLHFARGALFENFVINEVMKNHLNQGLRPKLYFWAESAGHEIDLIVEAGANIFPIEIKSADTIRPDFFKNLEQFQKISQTPAENCYLVYAGDQQQDRAQAKVRRWEDLSGLPIY